MRFLKYIPFLLILFFIPNVYASNTNVSSKIRYNPDTGGGTYKGDEIYLGGYNGVFSVNTRYNGRLAMMSFYISTSDYNFTTNHTYTITLNMATEDWRNNFMGPQVANAQSNGTLGSSLSISNFRFVSMKQIKFNFKTSGTLNPYIFFRLYSTDYANPNGGTTAITGVNNWKLSSIYINDNVGSTPSPAPVTPAPTPTPQPNNQDIINNQNQNTQDIINNQNNNNQNLIENNNQNTTDIIDNNNQNTQNIIDNQKENTDKIVDMLGTVCNNLFNEKDIARGFALNSNTGEPIIYENYFITNYIAIPEDSQYLYFGYDTNVSSGHVISFFDANKNLLSHSTYYNGTLLIPAYTKYLMFEGISSELENAKFYVAVENHYYCKYGTTTRNKLDDTTNAVNEVNNSINNSNIDSGVGGDFFSGFDNNMHGLSSIITLPLASIQSLTSSQCSPLHIPIPFTDNKYLDLPCMTTIYQQHIPTLLTLIQTAWYGLLAYKVLVNIFGIVKGFKDPDSDKIEVMDL